MYLKSKMILQFPKADRGIFLKGLGTVIPSLVGLDIAEGLWMVGMSCKWKIMNEHNIFKECLDLHARTFCGRVIVRMR